MATILTFRKLELRRQGGDTAGAESGQVIIFPGIRYERWGEARDEEAAKASVRQHRDVLELAE